MEITKQIEEHLSAHMSMTKKDIMLANFLGGLSWGAGTILGAIIIGAILFYTLKPLGVFDLIVKPSQEVNPLRAPSQQER